MSRQADADVRSIRAALQRAGLSFLLAVTMSVPALARDMRSALSRR